MQRRVLIGLGALVALLVLAQLALPTFAEHRVRSQLNKYGTVGSVSVSAFPAIELLWGHADSIKVTMRDYRSDRKPVGDLIRRTSGAGKLDVHLDQARVGSLLLHDVAFRKRGDRLSGEATVDEADLRSALPPGLDVQPIGADDQGLRFEGTASLFGVAASLTVRATVRDGKIVVFPDGIPFGSLATFTVFDEPRVKVLSLGGRPRAGGFTLTASGRLAG